MVLAVVSVSESSVSVCKNVWFVALKSFALSQRSKAATPEGAAAKRQKENINRLKQRDERACICDEGLEKSELCLVLG